MFDFANMLQESINNSALNKKQIAKRIGISTVLLYKYETGRLLPTYRTLYKMCSFFCWDYFETCSLIDKQKQQQKQKSK